jgi:hypothetical protein
MKTEEQLEIWQSVSAFLGILFVVLILIWVMNEFRPSLALRYDDVCRQRFGCEYQLDAINPSDADKDVQLIQCIKPDWNAIEPETKMMYVEVIRGHDKWGNLDFNNILNVQCRSVGDMHCRSY